MPAAEHLAPAVLQPITELACKLAAEAGDYATAHLATRAQSHTKGDHGELVTAVDLACEKTMIDAITTAFPDHAITGEEHGDHGPEDAEFRWYLDPLDGTHNYTMGLATFGSCVAVTHHGETIVGVVHDSVNRRTSHAIAGQGVFIDGAATAPMPKSDLNQACVAWLQGYGVAKNDAFATQVKTALHMSANRVLHTWSPAIDWGLVAAGQVSAVVTYSNEPHDALCGYLIAEEAGGTRHTMRDGELTIIGQPDVVRHLVAIFGQLPG